MDHYSDKNQGARAACSCKNRTPMLTHKWWTFSVFLVQSQNSLSSPCTSSSFASLVGNWKKKTLTHIQYLTVHTYSYVVGCHYRGFGYVQGWME